METNQPTFLQFIPVSIFGGVMGLSGLCFAWRMAHRMWQLPAFIGESIGALAIIGFVLLTIVYSTKWFRYPEIVKAEFSNSISVCFFATFIVALLLIPGILLPYFPAAAFYIWLTASIAIFIFAWFVLRKWLDNQQAPENAVPAWFLPIVGTLDVPVFGTSFHFRESHEYNLVFFGIGMTFTVILMVIILSRLLFQKPLPAAIQPTMLILIGPFALAFGCYENLTGAQDIMASVLFYFNLFLLLLLGSKLLMVPFTCPFRVTWWAVSFPLTATTLTTFRHAQTKPGWPHQALAAILLTITTIIITYILGQTIYRIVNKTFAQ